jgi:hypothetical protein
VPLVLIGWALSHGGQILPDLLRSIQGLWWPLIAAFVVLALRSEFPGILHRLRRASISATGGEIELDPLVREVEARVEVAAEIQEATPTPPIVEGEPGLPGPRQSDLLGTGDPDLALIRVAISLEEALHDLGGRSGLVRTSEMPVRSLLQALVQAQVLNSEIMESFYAFWNARNRVIHGKRGGLTDRDVAALIDSGLRLMAIIRSSRYALVTGQPALRVTSIVPLYADASAMVADPHVRGVFLQPITVAPPEPAIYPTTRGYNVGDMVTWRYDIEERIGPFWYRDPATGDIRKAWDKSAAFIGDVVPN